MNKQRLPLIGILTGIAVVGAVALREGMEAANSCCELCACGDSVTACESASTPCPAGTVCTICNARHGNGVVPCVQSIPA